MRTNHLPRVQDGVQRVFKLRGAPWCGVVWCGVVWCGVVWCGVVWCGVVWCGVVRCGVVWCVVCGVVRCSAVQRGAARRGVVGCGVVGWGVVGWGVVLTANTRVQTNGKEVPSTGWSTPPPSSGPLTSSPSPGRTMGLGTDEGRQVLTGVKHHRSPGALPLGGRPSPLAPLNMHFWGRERHPVISVWPGWPLSPVQPSRCNSVSELLVFLSKRS